jgi:pilus assembly protein Flp/PilA
MIEKIQLMALMLVTDLKTRRDERGATAVEYGLLVAMIAGAIVLAVGALGGAISGAFTDIKDQIAP